MDAEGMPLGLLAHKPPLVLENRRKRGFRVLGFRV